MLSRACLATLCFRLAPTLGDAKRCNNYATRSCTFVFLGGARCPETLKNDRVERSGPRLESPLGVVNRPSCCSVTGDCIGSSSLIWLVDNAIFEQVITMIHIHIYFLHMIKNSTFREFSLARWKNILRKNCTDRCKKAAFQIYNALRD